MKYLKSLSLALIALLSMAPISARWMNPEEEMAAQEHQPNHTPASFYATSVQHVIENRENGFRIRHVLRIVPSHTAASYAPTAPNNNHGYNPETARSVANFRWAMANAQMPRIEDVD
jgi:hypothetical protein